MAVRGEQGLRLTGGANPGPELLGLQEAPRRELGAAQAGREAEVVLDSRAGGGLAAHGDAVEQQGAQTFGGPVDGGGQPSGTGADDYDVHRVAVARMPGEAEMLGHPP